MTKTAELISEINQFGAQNYKPLPIVLQKGEGCWVWDVEGRKYLDCLSAYSALNHGHRHPKIVQALVDQASKITLTSRAFHNDEMGHFLKLLSQVTETEMVLLMNTGAEAVETAIKAARKWGYQNKGIEKDKAEIIVCADNFHGRTTTIVSFSTEPQYRDGFGPFTPGFKAISFGDLKALESAITPNTVAFMIEPIQGEAGVLIPPKGYLEKARALCKKENVLFIVDEIQTGLGRTGKLFAYQYEDAKPDVLILGKALGGGVYPVSAVAASREILGVFKPGDHGSTFGGNPMACAVGSAALQVLIDENLTQKSNESGQYFIDELKKIQSHHIKDLRGRGLMVAIEIDEKSGPARPFCEKLMTLGVLAKETHGQVIRLAPPLAISKAEMDFVIDKVRICLQA